MDWCGFHFVVYNFAASVFSIFKDSCGAEVEFNNADGGLSWLIMFR